MKRAIAVLLTLMLLLTSASAILPSPDELLTDELSSMSNALLRNPTETQAFPNGDQRHFLALGNSAGRTEYVAKAGVRKPTNASTPKSFFAATPAVGSMQNPVPMGEEITITTDIDAQGSSPLFVGSSAPCETISITMKVRNYLSVDYYRKTYDGKYDLKDGTAAAVLEMRLNGYQGDTVIIPQNCLLLEFRGETPNVTVQGVQMIDREIAGNVNVVLANDVKRTLYKRYYYDPAMGEMRYLDVTAYVGGREYTYSFDLRRPEMTAEQKEAEKNGLNMDDTGDEVRRLQEALIIAGMPSVTANGSFDSETDRAVRLMQRQLSMEETGIAGPMFRKILYDMYPTYAALKFGDTGEEVTTLQDVLIRMEVLETGDSTGRYGTKTVEAVKKAQTGFNLEPTGIADSVFLSILYNIYYTNSGAKRPENAQTDTVQSYKVGDIITFGHYEQDGNSANGAEPIEWQVLESDGKSVKLISVKGLEAKRYNEKNATATYETCTLRKWLNNDFLNAAFTAEERAWLVETRVSADENPDYDTDPGRDTQDKIWLLSIPEMEKYFKDKESRACYPTKSAVKNGALADSETGACWWWLRSPGVIGRLAAYVDFVGSVCARGDYVYDDYAAVRPVVSLRLS